MAKLHVGNIVEDRVSGELLGRYLVSKLHFGSIIGTKFFLMSLTGTGVASGYHNSLEELEKDTFTDSMVVVKKYEEQAENLKRIESAWLDGSGEDIDTALQEVFG